MPLTLKQIRMLTPEQSLSVKCNTTNGFGAACRTAYKGRKEVIEEGKYNCEVTQDSVSQIVTITVKHKGDLNEKI